ncbi:NUDIX domain-containing protein [Phlyctema vagabunda]|uniref:NUDIX domain-containing protein n=1 Tax=Phlyctema vagabunda TaxID=108571 RepID=A0ABR4PVG8_9HELO
MKSNLDLVNECDTFPYPEKDAPAHAEQLSKLYTLLWDDGTNATAIGYVPESVFNRLAKVPVSMKGEMHVNRAQRTISLFQQETEEARSQAVAATCNWLRENKSFALLEGWRNELYPIYGPGDELLYSMERSATTLFGVVTYGVHMTAFVRDASVSHGLKLWIPRRSRSKQTYGGMLDNTVAGGTATGEDRFECLVRECDEEASLPEQLVREKAVAAGALTYIYITNEKRGGELGMIQPEVEYIYDLELPLDVVPKPNDSEVEQFYLWTVEEVQEHLAKGEFKPNCSLVILDFFIRHGILTKENEPDFDEIKSRIHRKLEFPGPHTKDRV